MGRTYNCWMLNCWCITWPIKFLGLFTCGRCCLLSIPPSIVVCWFLTWFTFRISDVYIQHISTVKEAKYKPKTTLYPWWFYHCLVLSILEFVVAFHLLKWGRQKRGSHIPQMLLNKIQSEWESPVHQLRYPANKNWHKPEELYRKRDKRCVFATCLPVFSNKRTGAVSLDYI